MKTCKIKDLIIEERSGEYGLSLSAKPYNNDIRYLRITDIDDDGNLLYDDLKSVESKNIDEYLLKENELVVARTGNSTGRTFMYTKGDGKLAYAGYLIKYVFDPEKINPRYMKYYCLTQPYKDQIRGYVGSTRGNMNANDFKKIKVFYPERSAQDKIVSFMDLIDLKIKNNKKAISILSDAIRKLYNRWFIQYNFSDSKGKPYKENGGKMVWNDVLKMEIPAAFDVKQISDIGQIEGGGTPRTSCSEYYCKNGIGWITPDDLSRTNDIFISHGLRDITELGLKKSSAKLLPKGTVLLTSRAPIGYIGIASNEVSTNQGFKSVIPNSNIGSYFVYYTLLSLVPKLKMIGQKTTFQEISKTDLERVKVVVPNDKLISTFNKTVSTMFDTIYQCETENNKLKQLRDFLLPLMISGQVQFRA